MEIEKVTCDTCFSAQTTLRCGLCHAPSCKQCSQFLDDDAFTYLGEVPPDLSHGTYCNACFQTRIAEELASYERTMEAARDINIYLSNQGKETRLISRDEEPFEVAECFDYKELVMRLAFKAAQKGFNTLVDVDIISKKLRDGTRQKTVFRGSAIPANADARKIPRDRSLRQYPN